MPTTSQLTLRRWYSRSDRDSWNLIDPNGSDIMVDTPELTVSELIQASVVPILVNQVTLTIITNSSQYITPLVGSRPARYLGLDTDQVSQQLRLLLLRPYRTQSHFI